MLDKIPGRVIKGIIIKCSSMTSRKRNVHGLAYNDTQPPMDRKWPRISHGLELRNPREPAVEQMYQGGQPPKVSIV